MRILIVTIKKWNIFNATVFQKKYKEHEVEIITEYERLNFETVESFKPDFIFFPHWSWIIPKPIHENYNCIVFHMTDLPFGRGGSPLQNLIARSIENTKISAIRVTDEIDAGDVYLKKDLNLNGNADEIFVRASKIIFNDMIPVIISNDIKPSIQDGEVIFFERREPEQSEVSSSIEKLNSFYDMIRMLDGEDYPKANIKYGKYKLVFSRAKYNGQEIVADVTITEEQDE